jgi:hypothetical protein
MNTVYSIFAALFDGSEWSAINLLLMVLQNAA